MTVFTSMFTSHETEYTSLNSDKEVEYMTNDCQYQLDMFGILQMEHAIRI